jgi:hypothetical protein
LIGAMWISRKFKNALILSCFSWQIINTIDKLQDQFVFSQRLRRLTLGRHNSPCQFLVASASYTTKLISHMAHLSGYFYFV